MFLALAIGPALTVNLQEPALARIGGLLGCWTARGSVRGKDAASIARGSWHLGHRYFMLQLKSINPKQPYETALIYGAGDKPNLINAYWMDTFGGAYSTSGTGAISDGGFTVTYRYPDSIHWEDVW